MRVAPSAPGVCTGCGIAKPFERHIDFEVTFDGPAFELDGARAFVDELVVCEQCVRSAAELLALDVEPVRELEIERDRARAQASAWREYAEGLERIYAARPEPVRRGPGRPPKQPPRPEAA